MPIIRNPKEKQLNLKFENNFKLMLWASEKSQYHPYVEKNFAWGIKFFTMYILAFILFCVFLHSTIYIDLKVNDITQVCANGNVFFTFSIITIQYSVMFYYQKTIQKMIEKMNDDYDEAENIPREEQEIILEHVKKAKYIICIWRRITIYGCVLFNLRAICIMIYLAVIDEFRLVHIFEANYFSPLNQMKDTVGVYIVLYIIFTFYALYCMITILGFQPMGPILMVHACGQLELARTRILKIPYESNSSEIFNKKLKDIAKSLQEIYSFIQNIQTSFMVFYELTTKTTIFVVPVTMYQIISSFKNGELKVEFICIVAGAVTMSSVSCFYSDMLMEAGNKLKLAIYSCNWENHRDRTSRTLVLLLVLRTTPPVTIKTMFCPLCLYTLANVFRQAYALFNLLNAAYN